MIFVTESLALSAIPNSYRNVKILGADFNFSHNTLCGHIRFSVYMPQMMHLETIDFLSAYKKCLKNAYVFALKYRKEN